MEERLEPYPSKIFSNYKPEASFDLRKQKDKKPIISLHSMAFCVANGKA